MSASLERFRTFYTGRNAGRRVAWAHSLGTLSLKAVLPRAGEKELHVSLFQALVLLLFNDEERLSFGQIRERVGLEEKELRRTLQVSSSSTPPRPASAFSAHTAPRPGQSLACGQIPTRVLRKEPQGKDVNDSDEFVVNPSLKNERGRIRINQIQMAETVRAASSRLDVLPSRANAKCSYRTGRGADVDARARHVRPQHAPRRGGGAHHEGQADAAAQPARAGRRRRDERVR